MADSIGARAREAREKQGLSRWDVTLKMIELGSDAPLSWLRDLEGDKSQRIDAARVTVLAEALGVSVGRLLTGDEAA